MLILINQPLFYSIPFPVIYGTNASQVEAFMKKENELAPPFLLLDQVVEGLEAIVQQVQIAIPDKTRKRRKGIPHRSPLF